MFWTILKKELTVEWRSKEVLYTSLFFAVVLATIFMFGFFEQAGAPLEEVAVNPEQPAERCTPNRAQPGPGILWIALCFSATIAFSRSFSRERESGSLNALRMVPGIYNPLLMAKCAANIAFVVLVELVLIPLVAVVFQMEIGSAWPSLVLVLVLGTSGLCILGTVLGAALVHLRLGDVLLPLVLFPLVIPLLVAGASATTALMQGNWSVYWDWTGLMVAFDAIYTVLSLWLFKPVVEGSQD